MKHIFKFILALCIFAKAGISQNAINTNTVPAPTDTSKHVNFIPYQITHIKSLSNYFKCKNDSLEFDIEDYFTVKLNRNIDSLIQSKDSIILWLNGIAFPNLKYCNANSKENTFTFQLNRDLRANSSWNIFYAYSVRGFMFKNPKASIAIGTIKKPITANYPQKTTITVSEGWMMFLGMCSIVLVTALFVIAAKRSNLLRANLNLDPTIVIVPVIDPNNTDPQILEKDIPYSLGRFQLAWWTYIIIISFIYIWMSSDQLGILPESIALLMGITGGTSVVSKISETLKISGTGAVPISLIQFNKDYKSKNFFYDLITDENGLSASRFQFLFFSIFFGMFLTWQVIYNLQFPDFSSGILMLMGISSTTYAGVKFSEK